MKRLTEKRNGKNVIPLRNAICGLNLPYWCLDRHNEHETFISGEAADKLSAYEDAEQEDRLVILPCKVGDIVWGVVFDTRDCPHCVGADGGCFWCINANPVDVYQTKFNVSLYNKIGKTLFLTREEAEDVIMKIDPCKKAESENEKRSE